MRPLLDAIRFALAIATSPVSRLPVRPRGDESRRPLPGDEVLPHAPIQCTHAVTIRARPADIWPWLAQMGCNRAGWYSYDGLDNASRPSADQIMPELQRVAIGDIFPWTPNDRDGFVVRAVEPDRALVLDGTPPPYDVSWAFALEPLAESSTRLIARGRVVPRRALVRLLAPAGLLTHFAMQRRQLLNIRQRVETRGPTAAGPEARRSRLWMRFVAAVGAGPAAAVAVSTRLAHGSFTSVLTHVGRRTGKHYRTVLYVQRYDPHTREATVISVLGESQWLRNIRARSAVLIEIGLQHYTPRQHELSVEEIFEIEKRFRRRHRLVAWSQAKLMDWPWPASDEQLRELSTRLRGVTFRPAVPDTSSAREHREEATRAAPAGAGRGRGSPRRRYRQLEGGRRGGSS